MSSLCLLVQMLEYCLHFCIAVQTCQLRHNNVCLWFKTHCLWYHETSPVIFFFKLVLVNFIAFVITTKFPILWLKKGLWFSCNWQSLWHMHIQLLSTFHVFKSLQSSWFSILPIKKLSMRVKEVFFLSPFRMWSSLRTVTEKIRVIIVFSLFFIYHPITHPTAAPSQVCGVYVSFSIQIAFFMEFLNMGVACRVCWYVFFLSWISVIYL